MMILGESKRILAVFVAFILFVIMPYSCKTEVDIAPEQTLPMRTYRIKADKLDFEAVNSYPQRIVNCASDRPPYDLIVSVFEPADDQMRMKCVESKVYEREPSKYKYPKDMVSYLEPTGKIESQSVEIRRLADIIAPQEKDIVKIVKETLNWTKKNIQYDPDLANEISTGRSDTQSAAKTVERMKGTCSEYTNVFIAVMRNKNIPAKFILGCNALMSSSYHAWAEFYLEGIGWVPVDPQYGMFPQSAQMIKLFSGKDFPDCGVLLKEINCVIEMPFFMGPPVACIFQVWKDAKSGVFILPSHERDEDVQTKIKDDVVQWRDKTPILKDVQILEDDQALEIDLSDKTLFIFGTPHGNRWLSKHMDVLDVRIADHEIVLGNASYSGRALRLILAWPNPLNPKKGMVIYTAQKADDVVGILRWRRDDRDYVIADGERVLKVGNCYKEDDRWSFSDIPSTKFPSQAKKQLLQDFAWPIDLVRNVLPASLFSNQNSLEEGRHFEE